MTEKDEPKTALITGLPEELRNLPAQARSELTPEQVILDDFSDFVAAVIDGARTSPGTLPQKLADYSGSFINQYAERLPDVKLQQLVNLRDSLIEEEVRRQSN